MSDDVANVGTTAMWCSRCEQWWPHDCTGDAITLGELRVVGEDGEPE